MRSTLFCFLNKILVLPLPHIASKPFMDKRISHEVPGDSLGDDFKGYVFRISGVKYMHIVFLLDCC